MVAYDHYTGEIVLKSEIPTERIESPFRFLDKFEAVRQTMNVVLPLGLLCIAFLAYTYTANPIGVGSLAIALAVFVFATISLLDAGEVVEQAREEPLSLVVWWMPKDKMLVPDELN